MQTWNASLAIGHPLIDKQHRELFAQADKLIAALRRGEATGQVMDQLQFLQDYCIHHFRTEELLMRKLAYPHEADHRAGHAVFEERFKAIEGRALANGESAMIALQLSALIRGWLIDHIGVEDLKLARFVHPEPVGPAQPSAGAAAPGKKKGVSLVG